MHPVAQNSPTRRRFLYVAAPRRRELGGIERCWVDSIDTYTKEALCAGETDSQLLWQSSGRRLDGGLILPNNLIIVTVALVNPPIATYIVCTEVFLLSESGTRVLRRLRSFVVRSRWRDCLAGLRISSVNEMRMK